MTPRALRELRTCWLNTHMGVSEEAGVLAATPAPCQAVSRRDTNSQAQSRDREPPRPGVPRLLQPALGTLWDNTWGAEESLLALLWL